MNITRIGAIFALLSVAAGAFGAHGLRELLPPERLAIFETAARYQMYHALALFALGLLAPKPTGLQRGAAVSWTIGILVFSGSLYLLATRDQLGIPNATWLGAITPMGGLMMMVGWGLAAVGGRGRNG